MVYCYIPIKGTHQNDLDSSKSFFITYFMIGERMKNNNFLFKEVSKICFCVILVLLCLIFFKASPSFKQKFYSAVYEENISFSTINAIYEKYAGQPLPFEKLFGSPTSTVFDEKLNYNDAHKYLDGVKLMVEKNYLVPTLEKGLIIFIGEKEGYGKTLIVQQSNGIDVWYGNMNNINVSMYEYVEKGDLLGEVYSTELYLLFKKNGEILDYKEYI